MGTNYYLLKNTCPCDRSDEPKHVGKSSWGWHFSLHVIPEEGVNDLKDWKKLFKEKGTYIEDEYGRKVSIRKLVDVITKRKGSKEKDVYPWGDYKNEADALEKNHAEKGLDNLWRHKVDGQHCIGHGEGTWDLITGEFS